jgi:glutaminase
MVTSPITLVLQQLHGRLSALRSGEVASYIPELTRANSEHFGICVATLGGETYVVGDADVPFTIQSISKPFIYGLALDDNGVDAVTSKLGVEPSGDAFNAISLEPGSGRPRNPMINAGAIATASLVRGESSDDRLRRVLAMLSAYAGRPLTVDEAVFRSEHETGHRNRAIGHLLRNAGIFSDDVDDVCDRYFRQCSVLVTCNDLAMMAATLANRGVNPRTGERVLSGENVGRVLSVMSTCGMYDFAGAWIYRVGMPAKSGVGGGVLAVLPGQLGIGVFSPRLDEYGNSFRGVAACEALSANFGFHVLRPPLNLVGSVRGSFQLSKVRSKRVRTPAEARILDDRGDEVVLLQLQGPLALSTVEPVLRRALQEAGHARTLLLDFTHVDGMNEGVAALVGLLAHELRRVGVALVICGVSEGDDWDGAAEASVMLFATQEAALEWCEEELLESAPAGTSVTLREHPLVAELDPAASALLEQIAVHRRFAAGSRILSRGDPADALYLLTAGRVEVSLAVTGERRHRLSTLGPGTVFGELAVMDESPRSADVDAVTDVEAYAVPVAALSALEGKTRALRLQLVESLARELAQRLRRANAEIEALAG